MLNILRLLAFLRLLPSWLTPLVPLIVKDYPIFQRLIKDIISAINQTQKNNPNIRHQDVVNLVINTISGYDSHGNVIQIPNPDK